MAFWDSQNATEPDKATEKEARSLKKEKRRSIEDQDSCIICLQQIHDRTILPQCSHDSQCFGCILEWIKYSNKCPLCVSEIGLYIIHNVRSKHDYERYFISPVLSPRTSDRPYTITSATNQERRANAAAYQRTSQLRRDEARRREELHAMISRRKFIYQNVLYAKHVASNRYTRYTPHPNPSQVVASIDMQRKAAAFLRRELQVWVGLDIEFLTNYIVMMIKVVDLRTEGGIKILSELLDPGIPYTEEGRKPNTEHLVHELYSYLRSPFKSIEAYDRAVQYGELESNLMRDIRKDAHSHERRPELLPLHDSRPSKANELPRKRSHNEFYSNDTREYDRRRTRQKKYGGADRGSDLPQSQPSIADGPVRGGNNESRGRGHDDSAQSPVSIIDARTNLEQDPDSLIVQIRKEMVERRTEDSRGEPSKSSDLLIRVSLNDPGITQAVLEDDSRPENILTSLKMIGRQQLPTLAQDRMIDLEDLPTGSPLSPEGQTSTGLQIRGAAVKAKEKAMREMENSLKTKALLQVKLAREKDQRQIQTDEGPDRQRPDAAQSNVIATGRTGPTTPVQPEVPTKSLLKEKLLREKLLLNRKQTQPH